MRLGFGGLDDGDSPDALKLDVEEVSDGFAEGALGLGGESASSVYGAEVSLDDEDYFGFGSEYWCCSRPGGWLI